MSKRPPVDLMSLTTEQAMPMREAVQRAPQLPIVPSAPTKIADYSEGLGFKVSPEFRRRFRKRAAAADLKLNELLFAALDAWEEKQGLKE